MRIGKKLILGYMLVALLVAVVGFLGVSAIRAISHAFNDVSRQSVPIIQTVEGLRFAGLRIVSSTSEWLLMRSESEAGIPPGKTTNYKRRKLETEEEEQIQSARQLYDTLLKRYEELLEDEKETSEDKGFLERIRISGQQLQNNSAQLVELERARLAGRATLEKAEDLEIAEKNFLSAVDAAISFENSQVASDIATVESRIKAAINTISAFVVLTLIAAIVIGFYLSQSISRPIAKLKKASAEIGKGKLDSRLVVNSRDEIGELADSFNSMAADLKRSHTEIVSAKNFAANIVRSIADTLIVTDTCLLITRVNQATLSLLQYEEHELIGKPLGTVVPEPGFSDAEINGLKEAAFISGQEKTYIRREGSKVPMLFSSSVLQDEYGEVEGVVCVAQDITERKKRERELLFANALLRTEQETSLDGILVVDENQEIISFNNRFVEMWRIPDEVVRSRSDDRALQSVLDNFESPGEFLNAVKYLYSHREQKLHDELRLKDGTILDRYSAPMFGTDGEYYGRVFYFRDVTERKQAEETLRESETLFRSLAETVSACIYIYQGSKYIYVNPAAETITGYTHDELMGMEVWDILHPDFLEETKERAVARQRGDDLPAHTETKILTKSGEARWLDITPRLIRFQGQQAILATAFDVTERKGWEDALRESEEKYRTILQSIQEGYFEVDLRGNLTFFNDSLCRIIGTPAERLMGLNNREYSDAETASKLYAAYNQVYRTGEPLEGFQHKITTRDGVEKFLESSILLKRDSTGQISGFRGTVRDITERKRAEEALRESEERYRLLFERNLAGVYRATPDGVVLDCNDAAARILGYGSTQEALSHSMWDFYYDSVEREAIVKRLLEQRSISNLECRARTKDGNAVWVLANVSVLDGPNGDPAVIEGTLIDITDRKRAEEALRESEQRYKTLFDAAKDGIMILGNEGEQVGRILAANRATAETTGYTVDELLNLNISDLLPPEYKDLLSRLAPRIDTGEHVRVEVRRRRKDGTTFPAEINAGPLRIGDKSYILGFTRDITERKQIEKEVTMLAHAVRSIQECVSITDTDHVVLFVNDAFVRTYGFERDEVIGKKLIDLVRVDRSLFNDDPLGGTALLQGWEGELVNRRKDGTLFPIHLCVSPIHDDTGQTIALAGVVQNITERKRVMEELRKAKEVAEAASRAKSEFLANMSHEIRTPMNGIIGMTELALDTELTAEQSEYLKLVKLSADSLMGVINDVLDFSKIEAGKLDLDLDEFNLQDGVDEVMKALGVRAEQKGIELAYCLEPGVPEMVVGDLGRLRQILINLVGNAIKFTERGEVIVRIDVEALTNQEVVLHFGVRDTGIGIPREKQSMIFESFTQADGSTTRKHGGTGLGLTISSQLVQMMGGQIWVESPVDLPGSHASSGSMFHFTATFGKPRTPAAAAPPEQSALVGLPVLVVDDNSTNRRILEVQLTNWEMRPTAVEGGSSALNALEQAEAAGTPFKLALLDFHMPGMDGLVLTDEIRKLPGGNDLKIIMMSSSVHQDQPRQRLLGIDASLVKPVKAAELLSVIRAVLSTGARLQTRPRPAALKTENPLRVLVAEDSPVNQKLIQRLLEKWGHTPVIARDGKEALALLDAGEFDLVLMDLQMPEIDGFEATATIRQKERGDGAHIPIIALTAHALKGDRERCIQAGMDDYLSKPIEAQKLFDAVETAAHKSELATGYYQPHIRALDIDALLKSFDGDRELVSMLAKVFADSSPCQLSELDDAVTRGDAEALARGAHALKGSVANFRAEAAVDAAARLEQLARTGDLSTADSALAVLQDEIEQLREELETFEQVSLS